MDLMRYLGAPTSLSNALKNFKVTETELEDLYHDKELTVTKCIESVLKLLFPYSSAINYESIRGKFGPFGIEEFISILDNKNSLSPDYEKYQKLKKEFGQATALELMKLKTEPKNPSNVLKMVNFFMSELCLDRAEFLEMYLGTDIVSTLKLAEKMYDGFRDIGIYSFFDCQTLSGMAYLNMHNLIYETGLDYDYFVNLDKKTHELIQCGMIGGVSTSLHRLALKGHTKIRFHQYGDKAKTVQSIKMYDINALYTNVIGDELSSCIGFLMMRLKENHYKIENVNGKWPAEYEALSYMADKYPNYKIQSFMSPSGQKKLYLKDLRTYTPLDGYIPSNNIAISFHGCLYHACKTCYPDKDYEAHPIKKDETWAMVRNRSNEIDDAVK